MADLVRTQCRDAAVTLLTGLTTTGSNVFAGRPETRPLKSTELPGLLVYTNDEEDEAVSGQMGSRRIEHVAELVTEGYAVGTGDVDKTLDNIEKEVRAALEAAPTLSGKAKDLVCISVEKENDDKAEQPSWLIRLTWRLEYHTREGAPDVALA